MKDALLDGDKNAEERNQIFTNRLQEKVKTQVDESLLELRNRFNENLELIEQKFKQNNANIRAFVEKTQQASMGVLKETREEQNTLLEGRAQAFTVQSEQKLVTKINQMFGRLEELQEQVAKAQLGGSIPVSAAGREPSERALSGAGKPSDIVAE